MKKITNPSDTVLIDPNEPLILPDGTALVGRIEWFLYALCCLDYQNLPTPMSRIEEFANALITGEIPNIQPQSRAEQFFLAILDGNVSDLPQPQSRSEVLLDKLARGEFDLSDVEPIQSRYELLLAYLIKNGGIGNIDYVLYEFSEKMKTMYNTIEKPFKSLELSGNTLVNCVLEDTENDDYTSFDKDYSGTSFTINGTSEGAIKSAILSGSTLVNLNKITYPVTAWSVNTNNNNYYRDSYTLKSGMIRPSTKYLFKVYGLSNVHEVRLQGITSTFVDTQSQYRFNDKGSLIVISTENIQDHSQFIPHFKRDVVNNLTTEEMNNFKMIILEYQDGMENWDIPYFEGMQSVKLPVLTTTGKNLFNCTNVEDINNSYTVVNMNSQNYITTDTLVEKGKQYILSLHANISGATGNILSLGYMNYSNVVGGVEKASHNILTINSMVDKTTSITFTAQTTDYIKIYIATGKSGYNVVLSNVQIEEGSVATSYEPHKTNILTVNEDVELRGIGDVQDTLDLMTGELTQRIGEVTFDGSEDIIQRNDIQLTDKIAFQINNIFGFNTTYLMPMICNNFNVYYVSDDKELIRPINGSDMIVINISTSKCNDLDSFKVWLSQNPVTVQYRLETESIKTVDLNVVDQNNTEIDKIHVFNEVTHVNASSDELTPTVNIGKSVSYPTIIKPNTKYTVDLKRNDKPLTVNLGGTEVTFTSGETRKTITTPSTLTNDKLSYYGVGAKCNEIMLIEGEVERNVDYFTGMQSVVMQNQMPILSTVGKNLWCYDNNLVEFDIAYIKVSIPRGSYYFSGEPSKTYNKPVVVVLRDKTKQLIAYGYLGNCIKTDFDIDEVVIYSNGYSYANSINNFLSLKNFMMEKDTFTGIYEPYKTSILSCNEEVTLRGIGDVKDTLDGNTGELTQRIGEIVLDGSITTFSINTNKNNTIEVNFGKQTDMKIASRLMCDKLPNEEAYNTDIEGICCHVINGNFHFNILKSKIENHTKQGVVDYLSQNPITVQYELATPTIKTVDLSVVDQDENMIPKIKSYKDVTHLEVTVPKQSLLPNVSAEVATDNSKDMSSLTVKHQEISETQSAIEDNIQSQSDEIDTALMATTEIFESILE